MGLAIAAALLTSSVIGAANEARARWDETRPVVITTADLDRGEPLAGSLAIAEWPTALTPEGAAESLEVIDPGARATGPMATGTPLTSVGASAPGDDPSDDLRRVAVPHGLAPLPVEPGDRVEVWATYDPSLAGSALSTRLVADVAEVVEVDDQVAVVAVEPGDAAAVTEAVALATVTLVGLS